MMKLALAAGVLGFAQSAQAWWENGHELIARGVLQNLQGTGDLERFISETNDQFVKIPWIEPAGTHYIDIDTLNSTSGNAGTVRYGTDFTNFRAGTFSFPTTTAAANARYGSGYLSNNGAVPWIANDTLNTLTTKMQAAQTYNDWYRLLPTAGALGHYVEDMHNPMHLTEWYNGNPSSGLHAKYEGGQFEDGSVWRYPELLTAITPMPAVNHGQGPGFINSLFNRIPIDYDKNVAINQANTVATQAGTGAVYYDTLWANTKDITKDSFKQAAHVFASALYTAYSNAGSPAIPAPTFFATPAMENSTITSSGPITDYHNQDFFQVRGSSVGSNYGVVRFDMAKIKEQYDDLYGEGEWVIDNVAIALETGGGSSGSLKFFYSTNDTTNIQQGSALRFSDNGTPLGLNITTAVPLLTIAVPSQSNFTISRFDSSTPQVFNWSALQSDILSGGKITLIAGAGTTTSSAFYYGGPGLSLEVSAHEVPEPSAVGMLAGAVALMLRRSR